jgi:hypothetical protein
MIRLITCCCILHTCMYVINISSYVLAAQMFARRSNQVARSASSKTQVLAYQYYLQVLASQVLDVRHC